MDKQRIPRKYAAKMGTIVSEMINNPGALGVILGLHKYLVESAWDKVSGAEDYTLNRFFKDGKLYITLNSSLVRTQLNFQREDFRKSINTLLYEDELSQSYKKDPETVKELIIR